MEQMILSMLAIGTFDPQRWKKKKKQKHSELVEI